MSSIKFQEYVNGAKCSLKGPHVTLTLMYLNPTIMKPIKIT